MCECVNGVYRCVNGGQCVKGVGEHVEMCQISRAVCYESFSLLKARSYQPQLLGH